MQPASPSPTVDIIIEVASGDGVVLIERKYEPLGWAIPGGFVDRGESVADAARREAMEETGLDVRFAPMLTGSSDGPDGQNSSGAVDDQGVPPLLHVDVHAGGRGHTHLDVRYLLDGGVADPNPPQGESQEIGWYDWDAAVEQADPGLEGILRYLQNNLPRDLTD